MIGSLIGAGVSAVGSIFGGIAASKAMKKVKKNLESQQRENNDWLNRRYNEDATQRADAQRILTRTEDAIRNRNKQAAATSAVMGGTEESVAATKQANAEALAEATSRIATAAEARKDNIENIYQQRDAALNDSLNNLERNKAANVTKAIQGVGSAGAGLGDALETIVKPAVKSVED